ncbi:hypothetical protein L596_016569 [Steinernema carpocapsae]|uniref:Protein kinase domain-containing protein n=1 Tax=Steinernema carpocapsae TaxID=34508 RepID=A0A4U5NIG2_STECR|nr:hypothetical protein L596_016569 [Steinernema carpocapsae]
MDEGALLSDLIVSSKGIDDLTHRHISYTLFQLLCKVARFEVTGFVHQNISPENLIISHDGSLELLEKPFLKQPKLTYKAPEILLELRSISKADMWSIGVIFAEMLTRKTFFPEAKDHLRQWNSVVETIGSPDSSFYNRVPIHVFRQVVAVPRSRGKSNYELLPYNKCSCPTDEAPLDLANAVDLLYQMLVIDPQERINAEEALQHPYVNFWLGYHWNC